MGTGTTRYVKLSIEASKRTGDGCCGSENDTFKIMIGSHTSKMRIGRSTMSLNYVHDYGQDYEVGPLGDGRREMGDGSWASYV
jgi:hypothetical protein